MTDPEQVMTVCDPCHRRIHAEPAWAYSVGLLKKRWSAWESDQFSTNDGGS